MFSDIGLSFDTMEFCTLLSVLKFSILRIQSNWSGLWDSQGRWEC